MSSSEKFIAYLMGGEIMSIRARLKKKKRNCIILSKSNTAVALSLLGTILPGGEVKFDEKLKTNCWHPPKSTAIYFLAYITADEQYYMLRTKLGRQIFILLSLSTVREISVRGLPQDVWHEFRKEIEQAPIGIPI